MSSDWLILHGGALGDLVLTIQTALRIDEVRRSSHLRVVSRADPGDLSACRPAVTRRSLEGLSPHWLYADGNDPAPAPLRELIAGRRVLNALGGSDSIVHRRLASLRLKRLLSFDPRPRGEREEHITDQWLRDIRRQKDGAPLTIGGSTSLDVPASVRVAGVEAFAALGCVKPTVLIHPGSGARDKCWPLECFLEVGRRLRGAGVSICFAVGPVEAERWGAAIRDAVGQEFPIRVDPTPNELLAMVAAARVVIGNDSGPAHLAALLETPTVTIFGPTSPNVWRPLGVRAALLAGNPVANAGNWGIDPAQVARLGERGEKEDKSN